MELQFRWDTGGMTVVAEYVIHEMTVAKYRQWVKLFCQNAPWKMVEDFADLLKKALDAETNKTAKKRLESKYKILKGLMS